MKTFFGLNMFEPTQVVLSQAYSSMATCPKSPPKMVSVHVFFVNPKKVGEKDESILINKTSSPPVVMIINNNWYNWTFFIFTRVPQHQHQKKPKLVHLFFLNTKFNGVLS